jgi:cytoskeletal protein CcmA (bactofilin family)
MFSKQAKPTNSDVALSGKAEAPPSPGDAARKAPAPASLISQDLTLDGVIAGEGDLHVDGTVRGEIRIGKLTLGDTGHVEGAIVAETVEVRGRVIGSITAKQVRLYGTAYVDGDITHEQLSMELGAFFQGRSLKFQRPAPAIVAVVEKDAEAKTA